MKKTVDRIRLLGWHLVLHLDAGDILNFEDLFKSLSITIVIDHMGRVDATAGLKHKPFQALLEFANNENVWIKVCGSERISKEDPPFLDTVPYARKLIETAPDRVLWGTDWPHPNIKGIMPNDGDLVDMIGHFAPEPELHQKLLVDNPPRLYDF